MKKQILTLSFALCAAFGYSQTPNVFPTTGMVGIGTTSPAYKLHVTSNSIGTPLFAYTDALAQIGMTSTMGLRFTAVGYAGSRPTSISDAYKLQFASNTNLYGFIEYSSPATTGTTVSALRFGYGTTELMRINQNGKVRIGSNDRATPDGYRLFVEQGILTEKVKVAVSTLGDWSDYVFAPDYKLMPLEEVEQFTKENKHLPNVPSASDMVSNGLDVAQMDAKLLEKIEELTLYAVQQHNENKQLRAELQAQKTETKELNEKQAKEIEELTNMVKVLLEKK